MNIPEILNSIKASFKANRDIRTCYDYIAMIREGTKNPKTLKTAIAHGRWLSDYLDRLIPRMVDINLMRSFFTAHEELLYDLAPYDFDSYCLYLEWDRAPEQKFYAPRRKQLRPLAIQLQRLYEDELDLLCISLPPGIGKSTIAFFFLTWWGGNVPDKGMLTVSHNASFIKGAYEQILKIVGKDSEYRFLKVFPNSPVVNTDAKNYMIDLENEQRFATFQFSTIGAGNAGRVRAQSLLYCDDLISGMEVALSEDRLQSLWSTYTGDLLQRKIGRCKELHISTRWSLRDICGRLQERYGDDDRAEFIEVDCYDADGNSNFDYPYNLGYTTEALHRLEQDMDEATFSALYRNRPIEREGQLYADDELRRYFELPDGEPDAIIAVCDTKDKGKDFEFMPVAYQYGNDYYLEDCVCNDGKPETVEAMLVNLLIAHKVQMCQFESNSAGGRIAEKVQSAVKERGGRTKITTKYTTANKETKIIVNSPWVKEHVLFKDKSVIGNNREYKRMMSFLTSYTLKGKNAHDDVPDGMAMLALYAQSLVNKNIEVFKRPF